MAKSVVKRSFYREHARVQEAGELVNPVTGQVTRPPSMTKQEFVRECDINNVLKQFSATGMLRHVSARAHEGTFVDLPDPEDFQESLHQVEQARQAFASLPSKLRAEFAEEPMRFLQFVSDPANLPRMRELGLAKPEPPPPAPMKVEVVNPPEPSDGK